MKDFLFTDLISFVGEAPKKFDGYKKYVSTGAVNGNIIESDDIELVNYSSRPSRANLVACSGDILFAKMAETEKTLLLDDETEKNIYSTGFCAIRAKENIIEPKALYYLLGSSLFLNQKNTNSSGATQRAITNTGLSKIRIKLPTMEKQREFYGIMDKVVNSIELRKKQLGYFDELTKSLFIEMFGDLVKGKYEIKKLKDISKKISDGIHSKPEYTKTGRPFLSVVNINKGKVNFEDCKYVSEESFQKMIKSTHPEKGDILYTKVGATYGIAAYIDTNVEFCLYVSVCLIKPKHYLINAKFLSIQMNMPFIKYQADNRIKGIGVPDLHLNQIREFDIIVPPLDLQNRFADYVSSIDKSKYSSFSHLSA